MYVYIKLLVLIYADDNVILHVAESGNDFQNND